jgi:pimeloyl-ACP methyl ester carboxylesterase
MRRHVAGLFAALVGFGIAEAQTPPSPVNPALDAYAQPQRLVKLADGRRIHLYCQGRGSPTVILTAGLGGWSTSWAKVQPAIAQRTRTCAWDRAGFGHSDPSPLAQTVTNTTADLEGALAAARIKGPYILVGHSAGAFEALQFTDRHHGDVVGMVLVDASVPSQATRFASVAPDVARANAATQVQNQSRQRACAAEVEAGTLKPDQPRWTSCFVYFPEFSPKMVAALRRLDDDPARLRTKISLSEHFNPNAAAIASATRDYGALPLVVLTQGAGFPPSSAAPEQTAALNAGWIVWHDEYAKLSTRGVNLIVRGAGHNIPLEKPQAVIAAIDAVVAAARAPQRVQ